MASRGPLDRRLPDPEGRGGAQSGTRRPDSRRLRDMASLLPAALLVAILPPYVSVFDQDSLLSGIPLLHLYIFGVWALAILVCGLLARRLLHEQMQGATGRAEEGTADGGGREPD